MNCISEVAFPGPAEFVAKAVILYGTPVSIYVEKSSRLAIMQQHYELANMGLPRSVTTIIKTLFATCFWRTTEPSVTLTTVIL